MKEKIENSEISPDGILTWRSIQKKYNYPVTALGEKIEPNDKTAIAIWRKYGIDHYIDRRFLKKFEIVCRKFNQKPLIRSANISAALLVLLILPLVILPRQIRPTSADPGSSIPPALRAAYQDVFRSHLTPDLIYSRPNYSDETELWHYPTLALVNHLGKRELDLYERHQPYRQTFQQISDITGLDAYYFAALFHAESDLRHTITTRTGKKKLLVSSMNAMGVSQVTRGALKHLNAEIDFYQKVISMREEIRKSYMVTGNLEFVGELAKEVGATFVLSTLAQSGYSNVEGATDLSQKFRRDPLHLSFRGLTNSEDLCVEVARRLDVLKILIGDRVDYKRLKKDGIYAIKVGAAYFYLDYLALKAAFPEYKDSIILEMTVNSYNAGRGGVMKLVAKYGGHWRKHRFTETQIHWNRFKTTLKSLQTIEGKLTSVVRAENQERSD